MAKKRINQLPLLGRDPAAGDKVHVWDGVLERSVQVDVEDLPGTGGGGDGGTFVPVPNPMPILNHSSNYEWDGGANKVIIRDALLLNRVNYPVATTQFGGGEFRKTSLTYFPIDPDDDTLGRVEIANFQLDDGEHITITVSGELDPSGDAVFQQMITDVALLKLLAAPFMATITGANGGKVWWLDADGPIPSGWQECEAMRGYLPMPYDPDDEDFETLGGTGGSKTHINTIEEMAEHAHKQGSESLYDDYHDAGADEADPDDKNGTLVGNRGWVVIPDYLPAYRNQKTNKIGQSQEYSIMNPYKVGRWIEFVGLG